MCRTKYEQWEYKKNDPLMSSVYIILNDVSVSYTKLK